MQSASLRAQFDDEKHFMSQTGVAQRDIGFCIMICLSYMSLYSLTNGHCAKVCWVVEVKQPLYLIDLFLNNRENLMYKISKLHTPCSAIVHVGQ